MLDMPPPAETKISNLNTERLTTDHTRTGHTHTHTNTHMQLIKAALNSKHVQQELGTDNQNNNNEYGSRDRDRGWGRRPEPGPTTERS